MTKPAASVLTILFKNGEATGCSPMQAETSKFRVDYVPLTAAQRFGSLKAGELDVLARNTTCTMEHAVGLGVLFTGVFYYDGQGFFVSSSSGITGISQRSHDLRDQGKHPRGPSVCDIWRAELDAPGAPVGIAG